MIKIQKAGNKVKAKYVFECILLLLFGGEMFAQQTQNISFEKRGVVFELKLSYQCNIETTKVFHEETTLAIDIIEMSVDGRQIFPEADNILREYIPSMKIKYTWRRTNTFYIRMLWVGSQWAGNGNFKRFIWNDLRTTNSYIISEGSKNLFIRYRIVIPFPSVTIDKLQKKYIPEESYSDEYSVCVDLSNVF